MNDELNIPDPKRSGHFLWTYGRLMRRLEANSIGDAAEVKFFLRDRSELRIASIYPSDDGKELYIDLEP